MTIWTTFKLRIATLHFEKVATISRDSVAELMFARLLIVQTEPVAGTRALELPCPVASGNVSQSCHGLPEWRSENISPSGINKSDLTYLRFDTATTNNTSI